MTRFHYISPSVLPSRAANSVHVALQCEGLARVGAKVVLYAKRSVPEASALSAALEKTYGVQPVGLDVVSYYSAITRADTLRIAAMAVFHIKRGPRPDVILSRNLYAAWYLAVVERRPLMFETHQLEVGARKAMQRAIMTCPWVTTVVISQALLQCLTEHHGIAPARPLILHDAAPDGFVPIRAALRRSCLTGLVAEAGGSWQAVCGYFGHLYPGRGIEIIEAMAAVRPQVLFLVFGGNDADVTARRAANCCANLVFVGHVPHPLARQAMTAVDVLLMPYQASVSIGVAGHDTARWMSPMKMFEYLASGVPVISSDLPVLREVLRDGGNALLAAPDQPSSWLSALDRLLAAPELCAALGHAGHADYLGHYTWTQRARRLLESAPSQSS